LVSAPWPLFNRPSLPLGALKAYLSKTVPQVLTDACHLYLQLAHALGYKRYQGVSKRVWRAEAVFSALLYPERAHLAASLYARTRKKGTAAPKNFQRLVGQVDTAMADWLARVDWSALELVGFTISLCQVTASLYLISQIKAICPSLPIVVGGVHVRPEDGLNDIYRPYLACHDGVCISVMPRDRDVSDAQESGLDPAWFTQELVSRTRASARPSEPRVATTWSDGENGGWFRQTPEESGFFGRFFAPYMDRVGSEEYPITPVTLSAFLKQHPPTARARVQTGTWNVGSSTGNDFSHWTGSERQHKANTVIYELSRRYWDLRRQAERMDKAGRMALARGRRLILEAQTSCFLFWGDAWIPYLYERTGPAQLELEQAEQALMHGIEVDKSDMNAQR